MDKAAGKPTSASSIEAAGLESGKAVDGSRRPDGARRTRFAVVAGRPRQHPFGRLRRSELGGRVRVAIPGLDLARRQSFSQAAAETIIQPGWRTTTFTARNARFVRVLGITRATPYGISFWDAQVFGPPDSSTGAPESVSAPSISGLAWQGQLLTASPGTWTNSPSSFTYQWQRCDTAGTNCSPIPGATSASYRLTATEVGATIRTQVTAPTHSAPVRPLRTRQRLVIEDKAAGKPTSASSFEATGLESGKAVDGASATRWSSAYVDSQWWQVDLGSIRSVDSVALNWEAAYASQYQILTSLDGRVSRRRRKNDRPARLETTAFTARNARFVRVLGITRATPYGISFWDAQVFGPPDSGGGSNQPPSPVSTAHRLPRPGRWVTRSPSPVTLSDPEQGALPASSLSWTLLLQHCPSNCHSHTCSAGRG